MAILYAVICRAKDAAILVEYASEALTGNAPQVTTALLEHLRDNPGAVGEGDLTTYVHRNEKGGSDDIFGQFLQACTMSITTTEELDLGSVQENYFHLWQQSGVFFCCLADDPDPREQKVNFAFLQAVANDFTDKYTPRRIKNCNAYALDKDFKPLLRTAMDYYNTNHKMLGRDVKINGLLTKVEDMKALLGRNLHLLLERDQKLERLVEKSEQTRIDSLVFKKKAVKLKNHHRGQSYKLGFLIAGIFVLILYTILVGNCGFKFDRCGGNGGR
mmetsp:Transcript_101687/g.152374  ORF Transcript_101687/g.152374 Transcript_101687/m.152374 type:complete len:273 (-) Transcript_101687:172-990(-)